MVILPSPQLDAAWAQRCLRNRLLRRFLQTHNTNALPNSTYAMVKAVLVAEWLRNVPVALSGIWRKSLSDKWRKCLWEGALGQPYIIQLALHALRKSVGYRRRQVSADSR
jgi:hypothetical protein